MPDRLSTYTHPEMGLILIDFHAPSGRNIASFTTEILTGHVAVYHRDKIWRSAVEGDWEINIIARQLSELIQRCDAPAWLRVIADDELRKSLPEAFRNGER